MRVLLVFLAAILVGQGQTVPPDGEPAKATASADASAAKKPPEKGRITGQVVNETAGEPLRKGTVTAFSPEGGNRESLEASTDAAGKYHLDDVTPGKYKVTAARNGFVTTTYGAKGANSEGTVVTVGPGGTAEANFKLTPHSVVTGRIVDEDGEPVAGAQVHLSSFMRSNGKRMLIPGDSGSTNDLGEYRLFGVAPGKYFFSAVYNPRQWNQARVAGDAPAAAYPPTYYPGTTDMRSATRVDVPKGGHLDGIDLALRKARGYRVSGLVRTSVPGQSTPGRNMVMLTPKSDELSNSWEMNSMKPTDAEGRFVFEGVLPGDYEITGNAFGGDGRASARQEISVGHDNITGIVLNMAPVWEMKGRLRIDGDAPGVNLNQIHLSLESEQQGAIIMGPRPFGVVKDDGSLVFNGVSAERFRLSASDLPEGYYIKQARAGSTDLLERAVDFGTLQGAALDVLISPKGGIVQGSVKNDKDELVTTGTVALVPEATKRGNHALFKQAALDQYGHYKITGITPGSYSLYAFQDVEAGIWEDPDYLKTIEKKATDVTLAEGGHETQDLKVIAGEDN